jgi:hypothetical protein
MEMSESELSEMMRRIWEEHNRSLKVQKEKQDANDSSR